MTPVKILQAATSALTLEVFIASLARHLEAGGHTVVLASSKSDSTGSVGCVRRLQEAGLTVRTMTMQREISPLYDCLSLVELYRFIRGESFDIVHTYTSKAGFIGRLAARAAGVPVVVHTAYDLHFRSRVKPVSRLAYFLLERFAARYCDAILFVSDAVREAAVANGLKRPSQLIKIGMGVDLDKFCVDSSSTRQARKDLGLKTDDNVVGTIARLVPHKGIDCFLQAATVVLRVLPRTRVLVVGEGPLRRELENLAVSLGIADSVAFTGFLERSLDIPRVLAAMDVFVLPSRREGFGVVFAEAMAMGVPVVGSRIAPITEVVVDGETGILVPPGNHRLLAEAIVSLLKDDARKKQMGQAGRARVERLFDQRTVFQRTESLYRQLLRHKGALRE